jgi:hypothetical protein
VATAHLCLCTIPCNAKPERILNPFTKLMTATKVLDIPELYFAHSERGALLMYDKFQTNPRHYFSTINFQTS